MFVFALGMLALGAGVGFLGSALGLGGGVLMVPAFLEFIPGMDPHTAKGTSLLIIIFVAAVNVWRLNHGRDDWQLGLAGNIAIGSIAGAFFGGWVTNYLSGYAVTWIFIGVLGIMGIRTFLIEPRHVSKEDVQKRWIVSILIGMAVGTASGMSGIGGGAVLVPLALIAGLVTNGRVVALSNAVMVASCASGALAHVLSEQQFDGMPWTFGQVNVALVPLVFIGAQVGSPLGKWLNARLTLKRRRVVMGVVLLLIVARQAWRVLQ
jgi:uncharacterized protein